VSGSGHRPPGPRTAGRRAGPDRPVTHGFSRIPEPARPVVIEVMEQLGIGALYDLCAGLRFELAEVARMQPDGEGGWVLNGEVVPLPEETSQRLGELKELLSAKVAETGRRPAELAADLLKLATSEVRRRLGADCAWRRHVVVSTRTLHQIADEQADRLLGDDPVRLRVYRRSPYARPGSVRPPTTTKVADAYDAALAPLLEAIWQRLTREARAALEGLGGTR